MTAIERRLRAIEAAAKAENEPHPVIVTSDPEAAEAEFRKKYPDYGGTLILLPERDED